MVLFTVGHSTHPLEALVRLLERHDVRLLADVRTAPRSRRTPQFNTEALAEALPAAGIGYEHLPALGGWRKPRPGSPNDGWRNTSFRGYADHMASEEFAAGLERLTALGAERRTAIMCAEAVWWRCHRRLVADALAIRGWDVQHIGADGRVAPHELTPFAAVEGEAISYPAAPALF